MEFLNLLGHRAADGANHTAALGRASADASTFTMDVMDPTTDPVPVIATLPMGGGAVTGPGAGVLHVQWGIGNELRVSRVRGTEPGTAVGHFRGRIGGGIERSRVRCAVVSHRPGRERYARQISHPRALFSTQPSGKHSGRRAR